MMATSVEILTLRQSRQNTNVTIYNEILYDKIMKKN